MSELDVLSEQIFSVVRSYCGAEFARLHALASNQVASELSELRAQLEHETERVNVLTRNLETHSDAIDSMRREHRRELDYLRALEAK